ncbi:hypothetical protein Tco_0618313 [Tanacetum coccineum]
MSSHKCPELSKRFSNSIPKTVDEMLKRIDGYVWSEEAFWDTELPKGEFQRKETPEHRPPFRPQEHHAPYIAPHRPHKDFHRKENHRDNRVVLTLYSLVSSPKEILATKHQLCLPQPPPLVGAPSKENLNKYCDYHNKKGHNTNDCFHLKKQLEIALESGRLNHLVKDVRQRGKGRGQKGNAPQKGKIINMVRYQAEDRKRKSMMIDENRMNVPIMFPPVLARDLSEEVIMVEAEVEGYLVQRYMWTKEHPLRSCMSIVSTCFIHPSEQG